MKFLVDNTGLELETPKEATEELWLIKNLYLNIYNKKYNNVYINIICINFINFFKNINFYVYVYI